MNETIENIIKRFSCRRFKNKPVEDEIIKQIIDAAKYAPNGKNQQAWHFTIIKTEAGKEILRDAAGKTPPNDFPLGKKVSPPGMGEMIMRWPFQGDFCGAPVVVIISQDPNAAWPDIGPVLAAQNLMIAATSLGLASLWSTTFTRDLFRDEESKKLRSQLVPDGYEIKATIFVGYAGKEPSERPPRKQNNETWM